MGIRLRSETGRLWTVVLAPDLAVAEEESLLRSEAVLLRERSAGERVHQRHMRNSDASVVGRVFAERELSVQLHIVGGRKLAIFFDETFRAALEFFQVLLGPPVVEVALCVELTTLIVETVRQLVADHCTYRAEVDSIIHLVVVKRWLKNSGREVDVVVLRIVVRVNSRRRHVPFLLVNRLTDLCHLSPELERLCAHIVPEHVTLPDIHGAVVAPFLRVTD